MSEFNRTRRPVSEDTINLDVLNDLSFRGSDWAKCMAATGGVSEEFEGLSMLLAQSFAQNICDMLQNSTLGTEAGKLRTDFARQLLLSSITEGDEAEVEEVKSTMSEVSR